MGEAVRYVLVGLFGYASMTVPVFVAGSRCLFDGAARLQPDVYQAVAFYFDYVVRQHFVADVWDKRHKTAACLRLSRWRTEQEAGAACSGQ